MTTTNEHPIQDRFEEFGMEVRIEYVVQEMAGDKWRDEATGLQSYKKAKKYIERFDGLPEGKFRIVRRFIHEEVIEQTRLLS